jgi:hypothetical protein
MLLDYFKDIKKPQTQVLFVYVLILFIMLCAFAIQKTTVGVVSSKFYWLTTTSMMLFYSVANSIGCLMSDKMNIYFRDSVYSFAALAIGAGYTAFLFSGLSIFEAGSYSWLFKVVFFVYLVFMSIVRFMKVVSDFAQKEEWNAPKLRK